MMLILALLLCAAPTDAENAPTGLLVNFQASPALGIGPNLEFSWIVAPSNTSADAMQSAYQVRVVDSTSNTVWDSGQVNSAQSTKVEYTGPELSRGERFRWTVTTWSNDSEQSSPSEAAEFVTSSNFRNAVFVTSAKQSTYAYFRKAVAGVSSLDDIVAAHLARSQLAMEEGRLASVRAPASDASDIQVARLRRTDPARGAAGTELIEDTTTGRDRDSDRSRDMDRPIVDAVPLPDRALPAQPSVAPPGAVTVSPYQHTSSRRSSLAALQLRVWKRADQQPAARRYGRKLGNRLS